jgi:hypothetical protein
MNGGTGRSQRPPQLARCCSLKAALLCGGWLARRVETGQLRSMALDKVPG